MDNAVLLRTSVNNNWYSYRMFHAGMATPIPVTNGGTGGATPKAALNSLGISMVTLPSHSFLTQPVQPYSSAA